MEGEPVRVIDADGHVEENEITFSDKYFDPTFRSQRPQVVAGNEEGLANSFFRAESDVAATISARR
jgi:hypothetical protein